MKKPIPPKPGKMKMRFGKPVAKAAVGGMMGSPATAGRSDMMARYPSPGAARPMPMPSVPPGFKMRNANKLPGKPGVIGGAPQPRTGGGGATFTNEKPAMRAGGVVPPNGGPRGGGVQGKPIPGRSTGPANGGPRGGGIQGKPIEGRSTGPANGGPRGGGIQGKPKASFKKGGKVKPMAPPPASTPPVKNEGGKNLGLGLTTRPTYGFGGGNMGLGLKRGGKVTKPKSGPKGWT